MDKTQVKAVMAELEPALAAVLARHNLKLAPGHRVTYGVGMSVKFEAVSTDPAKDPKVLDWNRYAAGFGLSPEDLGKTFVSKGTTYRIVGLDIGRRAYPVVAERADGSPMLFRAAGVVGALAIAARLAAR